MNKKLKALFALISTASLAAGLLLAVTPQSASAANTATKISDAPYPIGMAQNSAGDLFYADNLNPRIDLYPHGTSTVNLYGQTFTGGTEAFIDLPAGLTQATAMAVDPLSSALFFTQGNGDVWAIPANPGTLFGVVIDQSQVNTFVKIASMPGANQGGDFDSHGNFFVASSNGGIWVLPRVDESLWGDSVIANQPAVLTASLQLNDFMADVAFDRYDNLYATAMFGNDAGVHVLSAGASTILGHSVSTSSFTKITDGVNVANPCGIDVDSTGRVYFGDWGQLNVWIVSPKTENVFDMDLTENVPVPVAALAGLGNQGVSVSKDASFLYSGSLNGVYKLQNSAASALTGLDVSVYTYDPASPPERQAYTPCDGAWTHVDNLDSDFELWPFVGLVANCQNDYVLIHFTGSVTFPDSGTYAFQALADDGFWMSLDNTTVINDWSIKPRSGNVYPDVSIVGGHAYAFDAWYYEYGGGANFTLTYSPDNGSTWATVPASYFTSSGVAPVVVAPSPTVTSVAPASGSTVGGTSLTITGTSFVTGATVTVGGAACTDVAFVSATSLTCTSPAGNAGAVDVVVTNPDGKTVTKTGAFTYQTPVVLPTISAVTPSTGATVGSRWITITGTGFVSGATVTVGGAACSPTIFLSATSLNCLNPGGSAGAKDVIVTNPDNNSVTLVGGYTYQEPTVNLIYLATQSKKFKLSFVAVGKLLKVTQKPKGSLKVIVASSSRTVCKVSGKYLVGLKKVGTCQFSVKSLDSRGRLVTSKSGKFKTR